MTSWRHRKRLRGSRLYLPYHFGLFAMVYGVLGLATLSVGVLEALPDPDREAVGGCAALLGAGLLLGVGLVLLTFTALELRAVCLSYRYRGWRYCRSMAWLACLFFPFGTVLGLWIAFWLGRPEIRALFGVRSTRVMD